MNIKSGTTRDKLYTKSFSKHATVTTVHYVKAAYAGTGVACRWGRAMIYSTNPLRHNDPQWPLLCDLFRHAQRNTHKHILCKGVKGPMVNLVRTRGDLSVFEQTASNNLWPPDITFLFFTKATENISVRWEHEAFFFISKIDIYIISVDLFLSKLS